MQPARTVLIACALLAFAHIPATAQTAQPFSIQASGLYAKLSGDAYDGLDGGTGFEGQLRYTTAVGWSFGAGYQYTSHPYSGDPENVSVAGPFFEPRYTLEVGGFTTVFPYVSGRFSILQQKLSSGGITGEGSGMTLNAGGGILKRLSPRINFDVGATFGYTHFGDFTIKEPASGTTRVTPGGGGSNIVLRAGLAIGVK